MSDSRDVLINQGSALIWLLSEELRALHREFTGVYRAHVEIRDVAGTPHLCIENHLYIRYIRVYNFGGLQVDKEDSHTFHYSYGHRKRSQLRCMRSSGDLFWSCELPGKGGVPDMVRLHEDDFTTFVCALKTIAYHDRLDAEGV